MKRICFFILCFCLTGNLYSQFGDTIRIDSLLNSEGFGLIEGITIGDIDNDTDNDILVSSYHSPNLGVLKNNGVGRFDTIVILNGIIDSLYSSEFVDFNNDGLKDILLSSYGNDLGWGKSEGNDSFTFILISDTLGGNTKAYDIDRDGDQDIVSCQYNHWFNNPTLSWWENDGLGNFNNCHFIDEKANFYFDCADVDNDSDVDILMYSVDTSLYLYINNGNSFEKVNVWNMEPQNFQLGDMNNNGLQDIIFSNLLLNKWGVAFYSGNNNFSSSHYLGVEGEKRCIIDLNFDNWLDIISVESGKIKIYLNNYNKTFTVNEDNRVLNPDEISSGDIDGNGSNDLVFSKNNKLLWIKNYYNDSNKFVSGKVFYDKNQNGEYDSNEIGLKNVRILLDTGRITSFSSAIGNYHYFMNKTINSVECKIPKGWHFTTDSIYQFEIPDTLAKYDTLHFGLYPDSIFTDISCQLIGERARCSREINYTISLTNIGTTIPIGYTELILNPNVIFISSEIQPDSVINNRLYWNYDSLQFNEIFSFKLRVGMPSAELLGQNLLSRLIVYGFDQAGSIIYSNSDSINPVLVCSYDPNDKMSEPEGFGEKNFIKNNSYLEFTIRFQNTGNDTAYSVMIFDYLDPQLDFETLTPLASSHDFRLFLDESGELRIEFNNIMLPDSITNESESHGFILFRIKILENATWGETIRNRANIKFDQNPLITTNSIVYWITDCNDIPINLYDYNFCFGEEVIAYTQNYSGMKYSWEASNGYSSDEPRFLFHADSLGIIDLSLTLNDCPNKANKQIDISPVDKLITLDTDTICYGERIMIFGEYQSNTGKYYENYSKYNSCDSTFVKSLYVYPEIFIELPNDTICEGESILFNNYSDSSES